MGEDDEKRRAQLVDPDHAGRSARRGETAPERGAEPSAARSCRVVVVEDDPDGRDLLMTVLRTSGLDARAFDDPETALADIVLDPPDVVVTDLELHAARRGDELALGLRALDATAHIGLIAVSGHVEPEWPVVRPFDAYLRKPIDLQVLVRLVRTIGEVARRAKAGLSGE